MFLRGCEFSDIISGKMRERLSQNVHKWSIYFIVIELGNEISWDSPAKYTAGSAYWKANIHLELLCPIGQALALGSF